MKARAISAGRWAAYGLMLVASFMLGRSYGWWEANKFMEDVARSLGVVVN